MAYKTYTANLQSIKMLLHIVLFLNGYPIGLFENQEKCDEFVAEFMR